MPTIKYNLRKIRASVYERLDKELLTNILELLKCELKSIDENSLVCEITPDRCDLFSNEGLIRAIKGILGESLGMENIDFFYEDFKVFIDPSVKSIRPYVVIATVRNVNLDEDSLTSLINYQEILHETIGRNRKKASIGLYDLSKIKGNIRYVSKKLSEIKFKPLNFDTELNGYEILSKTDKGVKYRNLLPEDYGLLLVDDSNTVLSMPPIINSEDTKITKNTKDILIDSTGYDLNFITSVVGLMIYAISFYGGKVGLVKHIDKEEYYPNFENRKIKLSREYINEYLGLNLSLEEIKNSLLKARYNVEIQKDILTVTVPFYRIDVLHPVDIIEDVAIYYGYNNIPAVLPVLITQGKLLDKSIIYQKIREILNGFGYQEIVNYIISNQELQCKKFGLDQKEVGLILIENPISKDYDCIRANLFPCVINFLSYNTFNPYPQKVYELGDVIFAKEDKIITRSRLCSAIIYNEASFEDLHSCLYSLLKSFNINFELKENDLNFLLEGRRADIIVNNKKVGFIGEINPDILLEFSLFNPAVIFELDLSLIFNI